MNKLAHDLTLCNPLIMSTGKLISTADAATELNVHRSTLTRMVEAGKLKPAVRGEGIRGSMFFYRSEIKRAKKRIAKLPEEVAA